MHLLQTSLIHAATVLVLNAQSHLLLLQFRNTPHTQSLSALSLSKLRLCMKHLCQLTDVLPTLGQRVLVFWNGGSEGVMGRPYCTYGIEKSITVQLKIHSTYCHRVIDCFDNVNKILQAQIRVVRNLCCGVTLGRNILWLQGAVMKRTIVLSFKVTAYREVAVIIIDWPHSRGSWHTLYSLKTELRYQPSSSNSKRGKSVTHKKFNCSGSSSRWPVLLICAAS